MSNTVSLETARELDRDDPLASFRDRFFLPGENGRTDTYFVGNSLGLQPKLVPEYLAGELQTWQRLGVRGHFSPPRPWLNYHQLLTKGMAQMVGAEFDEVITMNTLTVNLHLMMATFYRPTKNRNAILIESHAFPSDRNAAESQIRLHGFDPEHALIELMPDLEGERFSATGICEAIREYRDRLALILLPGVQYYSGQVLAMEKIVSVAREYEIPVGLDLAHAAGNVPLALHDWDVDFACWCTYKYLNSGPGSLAGCFIHQRHAHNTELPRMAGWWGHDEATRFKMSGEFSAIATAEGWQLSNPPILSLAAIRASLDVFADAGYLSPLRAKSRLQGSFFRQCLEQRLGDRVRVITPHEESGCQLSLVVELDGIQGVDVHHRLEAAGVRTDWREPNVIRAAPTPLYNTFEEIWTFVDTLAVCLENESDE